MNIVRRFAHVRLGVAIPILAALASFSCGLDKQTAPSPVGPSEFGVALTITASPGVLPRDGASMSTITVTVRGSDGQPAIGQSLNVAASAGVLSATEVVTGANGVATVQLQAPPANQFGVSQVTITVVPTANGAPSRAAQSFFLSVSGPAANNNPVANFTIVPAVANINQTVTVNAAATTDEGVTCGTLCTYTWDFGDQTVDTGIQETHVYTLPGTYQITLTVQDSQGGVGSTQRSLVVNGPSAPVAQFTVTPSSPTANAAATFNASASTVGSPATITSYAWDFGDGGAVQTTTVPAILKTYTTPGPQIVTLTITDSLGRTASRTSTVTVQ